MAWRQGQQQFLGEQFPHLQPLVLNRLAGQRQINFIRVGQLEQARGRVLLHHNFHPGKFFGELGQDVRQQIGRDGGQHADDQRAPQQIPRVGRLTFRGVHLLKDADGAAQERLAVRRHLRLAFHAVKEPLPQFLFQLLNLLAQRRLGNVALLGGTGEVSGPCHGDHVTKLLHFHRQCLW